jgi:hypothetical protein
MGTIAKFQTLDTSFVNLSALVRYLCDRHFTGRLSIVLDQYEADVFMDGRTAPRVREINKATGREAEGQAALERLLVRAREPGGLITVFEDEIEPTPAGSGTQRAPRGYASLREADAPSNASDNLLGPSGELIAAIERVVKTTGTDFDGVFHSVRLRLGDDYPFLDPTLGGFEYAQGSVRLGSRPSRPVFVNGLCEALRRVVNEVSKTTDESEFRDRVAAELAVFAKRQEGLSEFVTQLDRITGLSP